MRKLLMSVLLYSSCALAGIAQGPVRLIGDLPKGQILTSVVSPTEPKYSYALYIPSYYTADKTYPVIFAFDPGARGPNPVGRFKEAAENFGYIVVASNNSRNGLSNPGPVINDMIEESFNRFSIDHNRVYLAGLSGGARLALTIALAMKGGAAGVVICGAGFSPGTEPARELPFVIYGTVGDEDFNYSEMRGLDETLAKLDVAHHIQIFEGTHEWASSELCIKAVEWLELQAMKTNRRKKDDAFIESAWKRSFDDADNFEKHGKPFEVFNVVSALVHDFRGLRDVSDAEKKLAILRDDKAVKQALKNDKDDIAKEQKLSNQLISPGMELMQAGETDRAGTLRDIRDLAADIRKRSEVEENTSERRVARRVLRSATAYFHETATLNLIPNKKFESAILYLQIGTEIAPKNNMLYVEIAGLQMAINQKKQALRSLQTAVEKGFSDLHGLEGDRTFDSLHSEADWAKLIETLKGR